ncbi:MAG: hypothetical protein M4579_005194 [Chaenotheca gracillima]|nr:MAG: hypothetical protein M4579_005194 [Chaenotheca gracillima]
MKAALLTVPVLAGLVQAVAFPGPRPTPAAFGEADLYRGFSPRPTPAAVLRRGEMDLFKRDVGDNVCGYELGVEAWPVTCSVGRTCYFNTHTASASHGVRGCCLNENDNECGWVTSCVDYNEYYTSSSCGSSCELDTFILKCTESTAAYCQFFTYPAIGVQDFGCASDIDTTYRSVELTYLGEVLSASSSPSLNIATVTLVVTNTPSGIVSGSASQSSTTAPIRTSTTVSGGSSTPTSDNSNSLPSLKNKKKSTPIGAIVGGVVGGLAVIAAIIVTVWLCCLRSKRKADADAAAAPSQQPPPMGGYPNVGQPMPPQQQGPPPVPYGQVQYYPPPDEKSQPYQVTTSGYYGEQPMTPPIQPVGSPVPSQQQPYAESMLHSRPESTSVPVSPLPVYNRSSMSSPGPPSDGASQLHGESVSSGSAPIPAPGPAQGPGPGPYFAPSGGPVIHEVAGS